MWFDRSITDVCRGHGSDKYGVDTGLDSAGIALPTLE